MKYDHQFRCRSAECTCRVYTADAVTMRIDFFAGMLRVALLRDGIMPLPTWSVCPGDAECPLEGRDKLSTEGLLPVPAEVVEDGQFVRFRHEGVRFCIEKRNFRITAENERGILYQDRNGLAYNFAHELGDGSVHFTRRMPGERVFGLGDKCGNVNKAGRSFTLGAGDAMGFLAEHSDPLYKQIPFYFVTHDAGSYGIYYDTYSNGRINFGEEIDNYFDPFNSIRYEEENMVFYLFLGSPMEIIRKFSWLCGRDAPVPEWAFHYCGSTMSYTDAPDADRQLRGFIASCEEQGIPVRGFYLSSGYTQIGDRRCVFHWNREKIPSPEGLAAFFREHGVQLMPNVKPAFLTEHPMYSMLADSGFFLKDASGKPACFPFWGGMASYLDFTNPGAYAFWKRCVREELVNRGYGNIWNDNNEYDVWDRDVMAFGFGTPVPARLIRPLFSHLMARASREACVEAGIPAPLNVSRCAIAGTSRVASTWTGDNRTDFRDLRYNHRQAMTMALTGFTFFGPDIGGFAGPSPEPELFLRWIQYGIFLPRFVLHSWKPDAEPTMPWLYPELMPAVRRLFARREALVPYLAEQMERAVERFEPLIFPVFLKDPSYDPEADCFFVGENLLACPVFDPGRREVTVLLPESGKGWQLRGTGIPRRAGERVTVPCAPEDDPVWFVRCQ